MILPYASQFFRNWGYNIEQDEHKSLPLLASGSGEINTINQIEGLDKVEPMTAEDIYFFVSTKIREIATEIEGKDNGYTCHSYRHSRLNNLLHGTDLSYIDKDGNPKKMDINDLRLLANHNDISTTSGLNELFGFDNE